MTPHRVVILEHPRVPLTGKRGRRIGHVQSRRIAFERAILNTLLLDIRLDEVHVDFFGVICFVRSQARLHVLIKIEVLQVVAVAYVDYFEL